MSEEKYKDIIAEVESLPQGGITYKKINGKEYAYYQWREDGKQRSRRAKDDELETLMAQIERRKELEEILKEAGLMAKPKAAKPRKTAEKKAAPKKPIEKKAKAAKTKAAAEMDTKVESRWMKDGHKTVRTALYQRGEENQAEALITFLLEDEFFGTLAPSVREAAAEALTLRMKARMQEDMIHLETKAANPDCEVFHLHLEDGGFEMVIADPKAGNCQLYEIKHCSELSRAHCSYLLNDNVCETVAEHYGQITDKFVIYNGKTVNVMEAGTGGKLESVKYWNVEKYLEGLKK